MSLNAISNLFRSSSFRFALLTGVIIWLTTSAVLILVYFKLENTLWRSIDNNLNEQTEAILAQAAQQPDVDITELVAAFNLMSRPTTTIVEVSGQDLKSMHNSPEMQALHDAMGLANPPGHMLDDSQTLTSNQGNLQFTREITLPDGQTITISQDIEYLNQLQSGLWQSLIFGLSATLLVALLGAILLTRQSLRRIQEINLACQTITEGHFDHRIPYNNPAERFDDYDRMALVINRMLDEINLLLNKVKHVSDNIAHDLKSPLARLRAQLELASIDVDSPNLEQGLAEVDRLLAMIKSLLGISRIESHDKASFEPVKIDSLLHDLIDIYRPSFEDKNIALSGQFEPGTLASDRHLLFQALANLIENALKFTPSSGQVSLQGTFDGTDHYSLVIQDSGPGIGNEALPRVFDRFYREDTARSTAGFGLGLSLVKAIIQLHRGDILLVNNNGLQVRISLPTTPQN